MKTKIWGLISLALAGCSLPSAVDCKSDSDCNYPGTCHYNICVVYNCEPGCKEYEYCTKDEDSNSIACKSAFESISLELPTEQSQVATPFQVTAKLVRAEKSDKRKPAPSELVLLAKSRWGVLERYALKQTEENPLEYTGNIITELGGEYSLAVVPVYDGYEQGKAPPADILKSKEIKVTISGCDQDCGEYKICKIKEGKKCVNLFKEIVIKQPGNMDRKQGNVEIVASLTPDDGLEPQKAPEILNYSINCGNRGMTFGVLSREPNTQPNTYSYRSEPWTPQSSIQGMEFSCKLVVSAEEAGLNEKSLNFVVDRKSPKLYVDLVAQGGSSVNRYRLDESAKVRVSSSDSDVNINSVILKVFSMTGKTHSPFNLGMAGECTVQGRQVCREVEVNLWEVGSEPFSAFEGNLSLSVTGSDTAGNSAVIDPTNTVIPVTRKKWEYNTENGAIKTSPAIGRDGTVYFGDAGFNGKIYAIKPDGTRKWEYQTGGAVNASLVVGSAEDGKDLVFAAGTNSNGIGAVWVFDEAGNEKDLCSFPGTTGSEASLALADVKFDGESRAIPTVFAVINSNNPNDNNHNGPKLVAASDRVGANRCISIGIDNNAYGNTGLAFSKNRVYFGDFKGNLVSCLLKAGKFPVEEKKEKQCEIAPNNLAIFSGSAYSGGRGLTKGGYIKFDENSYNFAEYNPTGNVVFSFEEKLIAGDDAGNMTFMNSDFSSNSAPSVVKIGASVLSAPAIGADKIIYLASIGGELLARDLASDLASNDSNQRQPIWRSEGLGGGAFTSPALDCARDNAGNVVNKPGTLYVGSEDGKLYAIIVDSQGIETTAPWPKFHRDPRNTANGDADLSRYSCEEHYGRFLE